MPRKKHLATPENKALVRYGKIAGATNEQLCEILGISEGTLTRHYRKEIDLGNVDANTRVVGKLFSKCMEGNTTALIFWCKTRLGWREIQTHELGGAEGSGLVPVINVGVVTDK